MSLHLILQENIKTYLAFAAAKNVDKRYSRLFWLKFGNLFFGRTISPIALSSLFVVWLPATKQLAEEGVDKCVKHLRGSIHTIKFHLFRHPPTKLFISLFLLTSPFDLSLSLRIYAATIQIKLTPNKMETNLDPKY